MRSIHLIAGIVLFALSFRAGYEAQVGKNSFWKVDLVEPQQLTVSIGDMILVKSHTLPLVPANLKKTFEVSYDQSQFRLIAEEPPETEGRMGRQYYFVALAAGKSDITLRIKDGDQLVESIALRVTCH